MASRASRSLTIKRALELAGTKPVYVCSEATLHGEDVQIQGAVELHCGLDCANGWVYDAAKPTRIATAAGAIPVRLKGVTGSVKLEDFDLAAANATEDGGSSVRMFVTNSTDVSLKRVGITAGTGKDGATRGWCPSPPATSRARWMRARPAPGDPAGPAATEQGEH
jgi:hypothetical protein